MRKAFLAFLCLGLLGLAGSEQVLKNGMDDIPELDALVAEGFTDSVGTRTTKAGENLQRLAHAAYGTPLAWPLVWWANRVTIPDPERFSKGIAVKVPRLAAGFEEARGARALDAAYVLVYRRYKALPGRTVDERRWVLLQAASSGVDVFSELWKDILDPADRTWARAKVKIAAKPGIVQEQQASAPPVNQTSTPASARGDAGHSPGPASVLSGPEPDPKAVSVFAKASTRQSFLAEITAGTPLPQDEMEAWASAVSKSGELDKVIAALESEAVKADAPPQVHFALALVYKRKGLVQKEYAALVRTGQAAERRPEVVFNLLLLTGRKKLIESVVPASDIMVGELEIRTDPKGARVSLDGVVVGSTPLILSKVAIGSHSLVLEADRYQNREFDLDLALAEHRLVEEVLDRKTGIVRVKSNATNLLMIGNQFGYFDQDNQVPFGVYRLSIIDANYEPFEETIQVEPDQVLEMDITLKEIPARWSFFSGDVTGATVEVDGEVVGKTPLEAYPVSPGRKEITLRYQGRDAVHKLFEFDANQEYFLQNGIHTPFAAMPMVLPTKKITIDGKADDWADVRSLGDFIYKEDHAFPEPGNFVDQFKMAQDERYVYWYIHVSDGPISDKPVFNYSVLFPHTGDDATFHTSLHLDYDSERNAYKPYIGSNVGRGKDDWIDLWNNQGGSSDYKILGDVIEVRFSRSALSSLIKRNDPLTLIFHDYKVGGDFSGGGFVFHDLLFQKPDAAVPELLITPAETSVARLRANVWEPMFEGKVSIDSDQKNKASSAFRFDGSSFAELPSTYLLPGSTTFTLTAWVNVEKHNTDQSTIAAMREGKDLWQLALVNKQPSFSFWTDEFEEYRFSGTTILNERNWYHVAVRFDGTSVALFVNGKPEKVKAVKNGMETVNGLDGVALAKGRAKPMLGAWSRGTGKGQGTLTGRLGILQVYYEALSDKAIGDLYASTR